MALKKRLGPPSDGYNSRNALITQLSRVFGSASKLANADARTPAQWRKVLRAVLQEIRRYVAANLESDQLHELMLVSGIRAAEEALKEDDFWPGYVEGITRLMLILLGDYPDHRRRKYGRKKEDHYKLDRLRSVQWVQTPEQRFRTLFCVGTVGFPELSADPLEVLRSFRDLFGYKPTHTDFLDWYRKCYPNDYAAIFR